MTGYSGDWCENLVACMNGQDNSPCLNSGTPTGTVVADDCGCNCAFGYIGSHC